MSSSSSRSESPSEPPEFKVGQKVFIKSKYFKTTQPSHKLSDRNLGPYDIIAQPSPVSSTLKLPADKRGIHPVFHTSMLEPDVRNTIPNHIQDPPPPIIIDDNPEYGVEAILDSKLDKRCGCPLRYYVKWEGYDGTDEETSWIAATDCANCSDFIKEFHRCYPNKPGPLCKM